MATTPKNTVEKRVASISASNPGSYNINQLCYPAEISTDQDKLHYVTFFINVRGKSKFKEMNTGRVLGEVGTKGENRVDPEALGKAAGIGVGMALGASAAGALAKVVGQKSAIGLAKTVGKGVYAGAVRKGGSVIGSVLKAAAVVGGGAVLGAAGGMIAGDFVVQPDTTYRISDAITLHVSSAPSTQYSASYDNVELGTLAGGMASGLSATDSARIAMAPDAARAVMMKAAGGIGKIVSADQITNSIRSASKQNMNPFREVLFTSMGFREFAFDYVFYPKNAAETDHVYNIIKTLKYHMHPELSKGGLYLIYPSEFNIAYYFNGKENPYFHKISTCALIDMQVDYGGESFSSFRDGSPVEIKMHLRFRELETMTKDRITEGY